MIEKIEFYNTPDGSVCCKPEGKPMFILDESCRPLIEEMIVTIKELYPDAFKALSELYSTSERSRSFYEYRIVHRFMGILSPGKGAMILAKHCRHCHGILAHTLELVYNQMPGILLIGIRNFLCGQAS